MFGPSFSPSAVVVASEMVCRVLSASSSSSITWCVHAHTRQDNHRSGHRTCQLFDRNQNTPISSSTCHGLVETFHMSMSGYNVTRHNNTHTHRCRSKRAIHEQRRKRTISDSGATKVIRPRVSVPSLCCAPITCDVFQQRDINSAATQRKCPPRRKKYQNRSPDLVVVISRACDQGTRYRDGVSFAAVRTTKT